MNTGAGIDKTRKKVGFGLVVRDEVGFVMASSSQECGSYVLSTSS